LIGQWQRPLAVFFSGVSNEYDDMPDLAVPDAPWVSGITLDGSVFYTTDQIIESGDVILDKFHFKDGTFDSTMCQVYCDFG
jgi:hypothetical protein